MFKVERIWTKFNFFLFDEKTCTFKRLSIAELFRKCFFALLGAFNDWCDVCISWCRWKVNFELYISIVLRNLLHWKFCTLCSSLPDFWLWLGLMIKMQKTVETWNFKLKFSLEWKPFPVYHAFSSPENEDLVQTLSLSFSPALNHFVKFKVEKSFPLIYLIV